ncbi:65-kDa microtubule-associated protein 3-like isoform X3 [Juglans microcarpa x Juglans regia]|uniref:65-kDa microtubule-associated protein 3-like isoform X3 n=1 Tax=Juglans microcarpa x Juglans regia TaxID=2249226 RepID=UPI001B7F45B8|nr:65-kDa microtubule-associated protein 3-like isoform X3 [Juglans microcarpa x Juglans regia]XP_041021669.1 65-kDa microtubule-associated protein 3-like isoform X3 [Juglans microcarpa x Juglans regia]
MRPSTVELSYKKKLLCLRQNLQTSVLQWRDRKAGGSLKKELDTIVLQLEDIRKQKIERKNQFAEVLHQIRNISNEFWGDSEGNLYKAILDETDLSVRRLEELRKQLLKLQNQKSNRLKKVSDHLNTLNSLCSVLGMDLRHIAGEIHPSFNDSKGTKDVSNQTIENLAAAVQNLKEVKIQRTQRLQNLASALLEMWHLMDTPTEDQLMFLNITRKIAASEPEITEPNLLSVNLLNNVEAEVSRLEQLKLSKMKELVMKKKVELEQICSQMHMVTEAVNAMEYSVEAMESGAVDPMYLLEQIELQIARVKEEALSRKEILEKVEKWLVACQEESWLEEYNRDENRYNGGRGAHLTLKRAEKARALVNKIPAMVEVLTSKTKAWEEQRGNKFLYDGGRLLSMLEQHSILRQEKEQDMQRQKDLKRVHGQRIAEQEALYGSKPSPSKSGKKASGTPRGVVTNRKFSLGGAMLPNPKPEKSASRLHPSKKGDFLNQKSSLSHQQHSGWRTSQIPAYSVKKHSSFAANAPENESLMVRKPLSPVSPLVLSKGNRDNSLEDQKTTRTSSSQKTFPHNESLLGTPSKRIAGCDEENRTPKTMPIPMPTTPSSVSIPMITATTPATQCLSLGAIMLENNDQPIEYSFEEVRVGFILPKTSCH